MPPIIADGKVVFTAPDGADLKCLNLRNGDPIWALKRGDNDVYLAGVFDGKVVIVGKKDVRAISLDTAQEIWRVPSGMPSGRGVASNNIYYLPLKEAHFSDKDKGPGIIAIDIEKGKVAAATRSKPRREGNTNVLSVPGNLTFFDGLVISQSAVEIAVYPQLKVKLDEMNQLLAKNANDPKGLFSRGELRLDKGELSGAVEDLHASLSNNPPEDVKKEAETKLFDAMTELLQRDFNNGEKYLEEYWKKCNVSRRDAPRRRSGASPTTVPGGQGSREPEELCRGPEGLSRIRLAGSGAGRVARHCDRAGGAGPARCVGSRPYLGHDGEGHSRRAQTVGREVRQ